MKNTSPAHLEDKARLGEQDAYLFNEGSHYRLFDKLGAHYCSRDGVLGTQFAVWAPAAERVTVFGEISTGGTNPRFRSPPRAPRASG